jgi:hypothetical protein
MALVVEDTTPTSLADLREISDRIDERMKKECVDLREMLEVEQHLINEAEKILDHFNDRAKRIRRALAALEGTTTTPTAAKPRAKASGHGWQISEERIAAVLDLFRKESEPITPTQLAEKTDGIATETVTKACKVLRERELIRAVSKVRGGGWTFTLMPEAADAA